MKLITFLACLCFGSVAVAELNYTDPYTFLGTDDGFNYFQWGVSGTPPIFNFLIAEDSSAYLNHGTCSDTNILTADVTVEAGYKAVFGTDDRSIVMSTNVWGNASDPDPDHGTVIFKACRLQNSIEQFIFSRGGYGGGANSAYDIGVNSSQGIFLNTASTAFFSRTVNNVFASADGWVHWAITWNGNGSKSEFYRDGIIQTKSLDSTYDTASNTLSFDPTDLEPVIGAQNVGGTIGAFADNIDVDFVLLFDSAMSSNDILAHATSGTMPTNTLRGEWLMNPLEE